MAHAFASIVLHSHLPYVLSHGRWPHGTDWLCEAAAETYLPIITLLDELQHDRVAAKLTIGLSPVLCEQLSHDTFRREFSDYLAHKQAAVELDIAEFSSFGQPQMLSTARFWQEWYRTTESQFRMYGEDILGQFRRLQNDGMIEIITCGATHGYYPLLSRDESLQAQTKAAVANYQKHFGRRPRGIWLPECAYRPRYQWTPPVAISGVDHPYDRKGADEFLSENGIDFFIIDAPLLRGGKAVGVYLDRFDALKLLWESYEQSTRDRAEEADKTPREVYLVSSAPEGKKPVAIFTRDPETGLLVWSGEHGYPGDGRYLDFHKKRFPGGHRYWAVTSAKSDLADKVEYVREAALGRIAENAGHFVSEISRILQADTTTSHPILVAPYDAELFGHWWFEGPHFLKEVLRQGAQSNEFSWTFLGEQLDRKKPSQVVSIPEGSWGQGNHHYIWLNRETEWTWKHIYQSEATMVRLAERWFDRPEFRTPELEQLLKQTARSLMLMSASDWQFLISTFAARDYAELRLSNHFSDFVRLSGMADTLFSGKAISSGDRQFLRACVQRDQLFPELDLAWFASIEHPVTQDR